MDIILSQDVEKLGKVGDVVKVKEGYARNFLIPRKMAYLATSENIRIIEKQKKKKVEQYALVKQESEALAEKLSKVSCTVTVEVNDLDKLYGSVNEIEIAQALEVEGYKIDKKNILIDQPIQELGIFEVGIKLHPEVIAKIRLWVAKK